MSESTERQIDPRAVRVAIGPAFEHLGLPPMVVEPPPTPVAPTPRVTGVGILGGTVATPPPEPSMSRVSLDDPVPVLIDGEPSRAILVHLDAAHATMRVERGPAGPVESDGSVEAVVRVLLEPVETAADGRGAVRREVVVDGWRVVVESEPEARAALRERARRGRSERVAGGPVHVRAIIPGRIVALNVAPGDDVTAGQQLLVLEAMKMQNELRAPRDGTIDRVAVGVGVNVEVGDLLLVIR